MVEVQQLVLNNALKNYNYILWDTASRQALAIDPLDVSAILQVLTKQKLQLKYIVNTHEHRDHTGGNNELKAATGATVLASKPLRKLIPGFDRGLQDAEIISLGGESLTVLTTPGHTMGHISLLYEALQPMLFSGDTLFNGGVGNCYHGGNPEILYETFEKIIFKLPPNTLLYPGHDYLENNLRFAASLLPEDGAILSDLAQLPQKGTQKPRTLADEFRSNVFFRLDDITIRHALYNKGVLQSTSASPREVFLSLRRLRDQW